MAVYAIGDIQGCYNEFRRLLDVIHFDPASDQLWLAGDLVNRGPHSLEVLRFVRSLSDKAITVLGNHDLHLVATVILKGKVGKKDTLEPILRADDCDELIHWLRHQPLFHRAGGFCMLHAGLPPQWDAELTARMANAAEAAIQGPDHKEFLRAMYGNKPSLWHDDLATIDQLRFTVNCFTRLRYCTLAGELDFAEKGPPGSQPAHLVPWYAVPDRKSRDLQIIFGHWSTLGFYQAHNVIGIDTGCLWGGQLTAVHLDAEPRRISIDCRASRLADQS